MAGRLPALFLGHGSPMNAIEDNAFHQSWRALGQRLPRPRAVVCISAHWETRGTAVSSATRPETIHDFYGFPRALQELEYPAPGDPALAARVAELLAPTPVALDAGQGLDHGAWGVLVGLYPRADVPVLQLSLDATAAPAAHYALGRRLAPLRDDGVLVLGSGNIVHNLRDAFGRMRRGDKQTPDWATGFDADAERALTQHDAAYLSRAYQDARGQDAHPTPEHYLPLLYAAGAASDADRVSFPISGFDAGSLSMRAVRYDA